MNGTFNSRPGGTDGRDGRDGRDEQDGRMAGTGGEERDEWEGWDRPTDRSRSLHHCRQTATTGPSTNPHTRSGQATPQPADSITTDSSATSCVVLILCAVRLMNRQSFTSPRPNADHMSANLQPQWRCCSRSLKPQPGLLRNPYDSGSKKHVHIISLKIPEKT